VKTTIVILFIIGTLANLLKGADLLLRPHQKKKIQERAETLTLWAEETKPVEWYAKLTSPKAQFVLLTTIAAITTAPLLASIFFIRDISGIFVLISPILTIVSMLFLSRPTLKGTKWLFGDGSFSSSRKKVVSILGPIVGWFFLLSYVIKFVIWMDKNFERSEPTVISFIGIGLICVVTPLLILFIVLSILWLSLMFFRFSLVILEYTLKIFRAIAWRIVEYDRGAYAALVLIATIILGGLLGIITSK
jgi:hypothetical protein